MNFDGYTNKEQRLLVEHQMEVLRRKVAENPMTEREELVLAAKTLSDIDAMWKGANDAFLEVIALQQKWIDTGIDFGVLKPPPAKIHVVS